MLAAAKLAELAAEQAKAPDAAASDDAAAPAPAPAADEAAAPAEIASGADAPDSPAAEPPQEAGAEPAASEGPQEPQEAPEGPAEGAAEESKAGGGKEPALVAHPALPRRSHGSPDHHPGSPSLVSVPERASVPHLALDDAPTELTRSVAFDPLEIATAEDIEAGYLDPVQVSRAVTHSGRELSDDMRPVRSTAVNALSSLSARGIAAREALRRQLHRVLFSASFSMLILLLTIFAMFIHDVRVLALPMEADDGIYALLVVVVAVFGFELVASSFAVPGYLWSFFWWLDLISTLSIITTIPWFMGDLACNSAGNNLIVARAGRTARLARQGARALRIIRILRLLRLLKAFKYIQKAVAYMRRRRDAEAAAKPEDHALRHRTEASNLGQHMAHLASRKIVYIVMVLSIATPFLMEEVTNYQAEVGFKLFSLLATSAAASPAVLASAISVLDEYNDRVLYLHIDNETYVDADLSTYRCSEIRTIQQDEDDEDAGVIKLSIRDEVEHQAVMNILFVLLIVAVLLASTVMFNRDAREIVVAPVVRIMDMVHDLKSKLVRGVSEVERAKLESDNDFKELHYLESALKGMTDWVSYLQAEVEIEDERLRKRRSRNMVGDSPSLQTAEGGVAARRARAVQRHSGGSGGSAAAASSPVRIRRAVSDTSMMDAVAQFHALTSGAGAAAPKAAARPRSDSDDSAAAHRPAAPERRGSLSDTMSQIDARISSSEDLVERGGGAAEEERKAWQRRRPSAGVLLALAPPRLRSRASSMSETPIAE